MKIMKKKMIMKWKLKKKTINKNSFDPNKYN